MPSHLNALRALYARGAQFVLCRNNKKPLVLAWQKVRPALSEVVAHARAGGLVGAIPGSLGCFVVDVDEAGTHLRHAVDTSRWSWVMLTRHPNHRFVTIHRRDTGRRPPASLACTGTPLETHGAVSRALRRSRLGGFGHGSHVTPHKEWPLRGVRACRADVHNERPVAAHGRALSTRG